MLTPKDIQEQTFAKAFSGYEMKTVDEFLEQVTADYGTLYKENSVLKSKMKVLVDKLEEYRNQEASLKKALITAQTTADNVIADAQKKASKILNDAENAAAAKVAEAEKETALSEAKISQARNAASSFIAAIEKDVKQHSEILERLKGLAGYQAPAPKAEPAPVQAAAPAEEEAAPAKAAEMDLATEIGATVEEIEKTNQKARASFIEQLNLDDDFNLPEE